MAIKHQLLHHLFVLRAIRCYHSDFILCMVWHEQLQEANDWNIPLQPHLCSSPEKPGKCPKRTKETDTASCPCHSASCQMPFDCQPHYPLSPLAIKAFGSFRPTKQTWILKPDFHLWKQPELAPGSLDPAGVLSQLAAKSLFPSAPKLWVYS